MRSHPIGQALGTRHLRGNPVSGRTLHGQFLRLVAGADQENRHHPRGYQEEGRTRSLEDQTFERNGEIKNKTTTIIN